MDLAFKYPAISDLRALAKRRVPHFLWEYLDSATGSEAAWRRAEEAMDAVLLMPGILNGAPEPALETNFMGHTYARPFGIAPVGMAGAIWPDAEVLFAEAANRTQIPFCMSTVTVALPEELKGKLGGMGWFQLYPPREADVRRDMLARVKDAGFHTLVLTVDVPVLSWREREKRVRLKNPMRVSPSVLWWSIMRPAWALKMASRPVPHPRIFDKYENMSASGEEDKHIGLTLRTPPDWNYLDALRKDWDGPLIVKGVLDPATVRPLIDRGVDGLWVSSHGGRQIEAAPAPIVQLPLIRAAAGPDVPIIYDGAIRSGTDVLRALALGANFTMLGRAFQYGMAALGDRGTEHVTHILSEVMRSDMGQMGIVHPADARAKLIRAPGMGHD